MKSLYVVFCAFSMLQAGLEDLYVNKVDVIHTQDGRFTVIDEEGPHSVQPCFVDEELRHRSHEEMIGFFRANHYLVANKMSDGEYTIHGRGRLPGGGLGGFVLGAAVGRFMGKYAVYSSISLTSKAAGGVAYCFGGEKARDEVMYSTLRVLDKTVGRISEPFIHYTAMTMGAIGSAATGPF